MENATQGVGGASSHKLENTNNLSGFFWKLRDVTGALKASIWANPGADDVYFLFTMPEVREIIGNPGFGFLCKGRMAILRQF
jgi:hypothetical protein